MSGKTKVRTPIGGAFAQAHRLDHIADTVAGSGRLWALERFMRKKRKAKPIRTGHWPRYWSYAALLAVVLFFGFIRVRLLNFPLERDEGEYAYAGQLMLHGIAPYQFCYTMKLPGTAAAYAVIEAIFGQTPAGIHWGLLLVNAATIVLLYFLAARLFGRLGGVVASATFALLSIEPTALGSAGHATQFVVLPAVGGILILLKAAESQKLPLFFGSGLLLGLAALMKQPGVFFVFFGIFYLVQSQWKWPLEWRRLAVQKAALLLGAMLPLALTFLIMLKAGILQKFWFWTFSYASKYGTAVPLSDGLQYLWSSGLYVARPAALIWLIAGAGPVAMFCDPKTRKHFAFAVSFLVFSFAAVCPGFYFRNHYFILMFPAVSLLCAAAVRAGTNLLLESRFTYKWATLPGALFLLALIFAIVPQREFFFELDALAACRKLYATNPFAEALQLSDFIKSHSTAEDRIAVIGSEPEIYFYSGRLSATGYVYMYPLTEVQPFASTMQKEMISEIEQARPRFVVFADTPLSWLLRPNSDTAILLWAEKYVRNGYQIAGIVDMLADGSQYHWEDAKSYAARSPYRIFVFERVPTGSP
jgi:hypothetical protein